MKKRTLKNESGRLSLRTIYELIRDSVRASIAGDIVTQGAALSYYTFFAIAPLFVIVLAIAGLVFGPEAARRELFGQLNQLVGRDGGEAIQALVAAANKPKTGWWATAIAGGALALAATTVFVQLQDSLNRIWNVRHRPGRGFQDFLRHRLLSFAMVLGIGFLLLVSLVFSAALSVVGKFMGDFAFGQDILLKAFNFGFSLGIITLLFAMIFKFLPDVKIRWRDVWLGGFFTALLFNLGKFLFSLYIGRSSVASVYGAAGSLVIVLLWVYYSAQILFFGAQLTRAFAIRFSPEAEPIHGAESVSSGENLPAARPKRNHALSSRIRETLPTP